MLNCNLGSMLCNCELCRKIEQHEHKISYSVDTVFIPNIVLIDFQALEMHYHAMKDKQIM